MSDLNQEDVRKQCCSKQEFKSNAETHLTDLQQQIDALKEKTSDLVGEAKIEYDTLLASLEESQVAFTNYLSELSDKAEDKWDDLKDEAEEQYASLSDNVQKFFSKFS